MSRQASLLILFLFSFTLLAFFLVQPFYATSALTKSAHDMDQLQQWGVDYQQLRLVKGHFSGSPGEFNADVDGYGGRKHTLMKELGERLGQPGSMSQNILVHMGKPDEIRQSIDAHSVAAMPGPVVPTSTPTTDQTFYMIYKWRGNHDYLWFHVDAVTNHVLNSGWYYAGE
jgi:hypothetical protein